MADVSWPNNLPALVEREAYRRQWRDGRLRSPSDLGPGKVRRRFSATAQTITARVLMSRFYLERFGRFWEIDTRGGTLPFSFPHPEGSGTIRARFATEAGTPVSTSLKDDLWAVEFALEILP